ncbi:hypothetical protein L218DRAFT_91495 [Marasmius fiardii PR-910]|nr:hypothetical protein L218DRAFT_91495 [Marasmius fiardii PR-910]
MSPILPTIQAFPSELLHQIFSLAILLPTDNDRIETSADLSDGRRWPDVFDYEKGPWSVSRVCSRWRAVAICFPGLWRCFMLGTVNLGRSGQKAALNTWLERSVTSTISFLIQTHGICDHDYNQELFQLLIEHSRRWENIEIVNSTCSFWAMMYAADVHNRLDALRRVVVLSDGHTMSYVDQGFHRTYTPSCNAFEQAPQLSDFVSRDYVTFYEVVDNPGPIIQCAQLTNYEGSSRVEWGYHFSIVRGALNLESLRLEVNPGVHDEVNYLSSGQPFILSKLRTLEMWFSPFDEDEVAEPEKMRSEIRLFHLPALECLSIITQFPYVSAPYESFAVALTHSNCRTLQKLEISGYSPRVNDIFHLLGAALTVRHLCLWADHDHFSLQDVIFSRLALEGAENEVLLPSLNTIELKYSAHQDFRKMDYTTLVALIRSRWNPSNIGDARARINRVYFSIGMNTYDSIRMESNGKFYQKSLPPYSPSLETLGDLQKEGLKVIFREAVSV